MSGEATNEIITVYFSSEIRPILQKSAFEFSLLNTKFPRSLK